MDGRACGKHARGSAKRGPWLEAVRGSGRPYFGGRRAARAVQSRDEDAQSPRSNQKRISHLSALGARPRMDSRGFGTRAGYPTRGNQPHLPSFLHTVRTTPKNHQSRNKSKHLSCLDSGFFWLHHNDSRSIDL